MDQKRLFLALPLADIFKIELERFLSKIRHDIPEVKWVKSEQVHITLHFFGSIPGDEIEKIDGVVTETLKIWHEKAGKAGPGPFNIYLRGIGFFPNAHKPRVAWIPVHGDVEAMDSLYRILRRHLKDARFSVEKRPFHPHATLGRIKKPVKNPLLQQISFPETESRTVDSLILYESILSSKGARYEAVKKFPLA